MAELSKAERESRCIRFARSRSVSPIRSICRRLLGQTSPQRQGQKLVAAPTLQTYLVSRDPQDRPTVDAVADLRADRPSVVCGEADLKFMKMRKIVAISVKWGAHFLLP